LEIIKFQLKVWIQWWDINSFITHSYSMRQSLEETSKEHRNLEYLLDLLVLRVVHLYKWHSQMKKKQLQKILIQLNIGDQFINIFQIKLLNLKRSNQEDLYGLLIGRLIVHQEDNIWLNLMSLTENLEINQEIYYLQMLNKYIIERMI